MQPETSQLKICTLIIPTKLSIHWRIVAEDGTHSRFIKAAQTGIFFFLLPIRRSQNLGERECKGDKNQSEICREGLR